MRKFFLVVICSFLFWIALPPITSAITIDILYECELTAKDKTPAARELLFIQGLEKILLRLTGDTTISTLPAVKIAHKQIDNYIQSFVYKDFTDNTSENNINPSFKIAIKFNEIMVNKLLQSLGKPFLGKQRPIIMLWLSMIDTKGATLVGGDSEETIIVENLAAQYALPVVLPLLDLNEHYNIKVEDVLNVVPSVLNEATKQYQADIILIGKISKVGEQYTSNLQLMGDVPLSWSVTANNKNELFAQLMPWLMANLIESYAPKISKTTVNNNSNEFTIIVSGVDTLVKYAKVLTYLQNLTGIHKVMVTNVHVENVTFKLLTKVDKKTVMQTLNLTKILQPLENNDQNDKPSNVTLRYKVNT